MRRPRQLVGIAELSRPPRYGEFRPGNKCFLPADVVSSRRAVDRSPTQHDERGAASIGIISNVIGDNTQAAGSTRGRPLWLRCLRLTVGVRRCAVRAVLVFIGDYFYSAPHRLLPRVSDTVLRATMRLLNTQCRVLNSNAQNPRCRRSASVKKG